LLFAGFCCCGVFFNLNSLEQTEAAPVTLVLKCSVRIQETQTLTEFNETAKTDKSQLGILLLAPSGVTTTGTPSQTLT